MLGWRSMLDWKISTSRNQLFSSRVSKIFTAQGSPFQFPSHTIPNLPKRYPMLSRVGEEGQRKVAPSLADLLDELDLAGDVALDEEGEAGAGAGGGVLEGVQEEAVQRPHLLRRRRLHQRRLRHPALPRRQPLLPPPLSKPEPGTTREGGRTLSMIRLRAG